jgi:hypothetical protein
MTTLIETLAELPEVEKVSAWNDRHYVNLAAARGSRANADLRTRIWLKGDVLTIEAGKGYHSDAFAAAKQAVIDAAAAAGATIREA